MVLAGLLVAGAGGLAVFAFSGREDRTAVGATAQTSDLTLDDIPVDGRRALSLPRTNLRVRSAPQWIRGHAVATEVSGRAFPRKRR